MGSNAQTDIELAVEYAKQDVNPTYIDKLDSGWVFLGLNQVLRGCCFMVADPYVESIEDLPVNRRNQFIDDTLRVGAAIKQVTGAAKLNYLLLGNKDPVLHMHIVPRYETEDEVHKTHGPWKYTNYVKFDPERDAGLIIEIREALQNS